MHKKIVFKQPETFVFEMKYKIICGLLLVLGVAGFALGLTSDPARMWQAYLMGTFFFVSMSVMSIFFLALQYLTSARWSVNIRRVFEALAGFLPIGFVLTLILIFFGADHLYSWLDPEIVAGDALLQHKAPYLNKTFFLIRTVVCFVVWFLFAKKILGNSLKQDETGDDSLIIKTIPYSIAYIMFFAISYTAFSFDFLMSLEPHWFSTIFGVYMFGGSMQAFFAAAILLTIFLCKRGDDVLLSQVGRGVGTGLTCYDGLEICTSVFASSSTMGQKNSSLPHPSLCVDSSHSIFGSLLVGLPHF